MSHKRQLNIGALTRRELLRRAGPAALLGTAAPLGLNLAALGTASAQTATEYKALVCVFLFGGNDSYNTVLATDAAPWKAYTTLRNQAPDSLALMAPGVAPNSGASAYSPARLGGVLPIAPAKPQGRTYALHPLLSSLVPLFNTQKRLALVANVGPLVQPTTKAQYASSAHAKPPKLFSHNDQQSVWQSLATEGARTGWGGRMADLLLAGNGNSMFTAVSTTGTSVWLAGSNARQYQVTPTGAIRPGGTSLFGSGVALPYLKTVMTSATSNHVMARDLAALGSRAFAAESSLSAALPSAGTAPWGTAAGNYDQNTDPLLKFTSPGSGTAVINPLATQLQMVARMIQARSSLGVKRQVFFVALNDFDTHDNQNRRHSEALAQLNHGLAYFDKVINSLGLGANVTTFTASDFGRTLTSNGDGTDHGWGGHHFIMGGAVKGGDLYGTFPTLGPKNANNNDFDSSADLLANGALLPTSSVDQYAATLGRWLGLSDAALLDVLPNLKNFDASVRNLGFLG